MKAFKLITASVLAVSMFVATVICCCIGGALMAHFQKPSTMCCEKKDASSHDTSNPSSACLNHLTSAEFTHTPTTIDKPAAAGFGYNSHPSTYQTDFLYSFDQIYPRGSPPLTVSLIPLYLRTFTLRI